MYFSFTAHSATSTPAILLRVRFPAQRWTSPEARPSQQSSNRAPACADFPRVWSRPDLRSRRRAGLHRRKGSPRDTGPGVRRNTLKASFDNLTLTGKHRFREFEVPGHVAHEPRNQRSRYRFERHRRRGRRRVHRHGCNLCRQGRIGRANLRHTVQARACSHGSKPVRNLPILPHL